MKWLVVPLIACLIGGCADRTQGNEMEQNGNSTGANPVSASPVADSAFRRACYEGINATMFLNFCSPATSREGSEVMARWWSLTVDANRRGLSGEIEAAQKEHRAHMALVRIVTTCPEGLAERIDRTTAVLSKLAEVLGTYEEAA